MTISILEFSVRCPLCQFPQMPVWGDTKPTRDEAVSELQRHLIHMHSDSKQVELDFEEIKEDSQGTMARTWFRFRCAFCGEASNWADDRGEAMGLLGDHFLESHTEQVLRPQEKAQK